ncbi:ABC transporter ATP-binding protein [Mycoplasmatota bacterium]|nr:ABC transporter ATP-binding protein [Mycoplasmatota bacterium]
MEILKVNNLCKYYGENNTQVKAVDNVSFTVNKGEFITVVGESGSGKSTLLNLIGCVDKETKGDIIIDGENITNLSENKKTIFRRRKIGYVFQQYNLVPLLNVWENIVLPIELDGRTVDKKSINEIIKALRLEDRVNHLPSALSGGQQQRVAIARAVASNPSIILADEPTGNLDSSNSDEVMHLLKECVLKFGATLILITHSEEISQLSDRLFKMKDGVLIEVTS